MSGCVPGDPDHGPTEVRRARFRVAARRGSMAAAGALVAAVLAACGGGDTEPAPPAAAPAAPAPASPGTGAGGATQSPPPAAAPAPAPALPAAVRAVRTVAIPLPAGQEPIDPVEGLQDGTSSNAGQPIPGPRSLLIDDAATTLIFGLRATAATAPRAYSLFRLDLASASPTPQLVYDALQRGADVALCPTGGIRYSLSQDGSELMLPETTALTGGGCSSGGNVRGRLMALDLRRASVSAATLLQLDGHSVAGVNWTATWSHEEVALMAFAQPGAVRSIRYLTRPGRQASELRAWPSVPVPVTLTAFDVDSQWMNGQLQIVPGGSLSSVGFLSGDFARSPGWYRASFSLSGPGSVDRVADAWAPGIVGLIDSVYANRGMTRTGTAVGADGRLGVPLPSFGNATLPAYDAQGDIAATICRTHPTASLYAVATGQSAPAPGLDPTATVNALLCAPGRTSSVGVIAVRGESRVLLASGGTLYGYDLQSGILKTGRVSADLTRHGVSPDGRWLVTRRVDGGSLVFELHDTQSWGEVPRN